MSEVKKWFSLVKEIPTEDKSPEIVELLKKTLLEFHDKRYQNIFKPVDTREQALLDAAEGEELKENQPLAHITYPEDMPQGQIEELEMPKMAVFAVLADPEKDDMEDGLITEFEGEKYRICAAEFSYFEGMDLSTHPYIGPFISYYSHLAIIERKGLSYKIISMKELDTKPTD